MKYMGEELGLFQDDLKTKDGKIIKEEEITNTLCIYYFNILTDIQRQKRPPLEETFIKAYKDNYHVELSLEEFIELKDYAQTFYSDSVTSKIFEGFETGTLTRIKVL